MLTELSGRHVMVIGLGASGQAAAHLLAAHNAALVLTDNRNEIALEKIPNAELHLGAEDAAWLRGIDLVVVSPGVPADSLLLRAARAAAIPVIGELELASWFVRAPIVAVTGTNGKSTVTMMLGAILQKAGRKTFIGGNLGTPLSEAAGRDLDVAVAEVSSYQLETIEGFRPRVGVHLNLSDDHLDRHRDREEYAQAKARLFENQNETDWAVLNRDDPEVWKLAARVRSRVLGFGFARPPRGLAVWLDANELRFDAGRGLGEISLKQFKLQGAHNFANAMAAAAAALAMDVEPGTIAEALAEFRGLPHRLEFVREKDGVRFIDDSKGTNVGAVVEALNAVGDGPVILIAGGGDKGGSYEPLREAVIRRGVKLIALIGAARGKMSAALNAATAVISVETLAEAVHLAAQNADPGDTVLLSPACSSFDQFKDYAERGRIFQELVRAL